MQNGWTGGQYSAVRVLLGVGLALFFWTLWPELRDVVERARFDAGVLQWPSSWNALAWWPGPGLARGLVLAGVAASLLLALGWRDREAAILAAYSVLALTWYDSREALAQAGSAVLACGVCAALPRAPYGSLAARGRADPAGGWRYPAQVLSAAFLLFVGGHFPLLRELLGSLGRPVGILAVVAYGSRRARPVIWSGLVGLDLVELARGEPHGRPWSWMLVALAFDPAWIPPRTRAGVRVYYDGTCGLCARWVRFLLSEERAAALRFAPLAGEAFEREIPAERRAALPDSVVVRTDTGELLVRSEAARFLLLQLGGLWRVAGVLLGLVPRGLRDAAYDAVASVRKRLFAPPSSACPLGPPEITRRFDP